MGSFLVPAAILGGGAVLQGTASAIGSVVQARAAREAAREARRTGRRAEQIIDQSTPAARRDLESGFTGAESALRSVQDMLAQGQDELAGVFQQERDVGAAALDRLEDVLLGGDISQLEIDPGFEFRREQGEQAIARQAAAAGSFGSGGNLKDFSRFNQGLASQEFGAAISRLAGLQQVGSQANRSFAQLNQGLLGQRAQVGQGLAQVSQNRGASLAQLTQTAAANRANALANQAATVNAFNLQAANAAAAGFQGAGSAVNNAATLLALSRLFRGAPGQTGLQPFNLQAPPIGPGTRFGFAQPNVLQG